MEIATEFEKSVARNKENGKVDESLAKKKEPATKKEKEREGLKLFTLISRPPLPFPQRLKKKVKD
ncbi:hypothetical protein HAX54_042445, partial [Datura stramonium]|nr:hypothetical protein [Datura stramonium]